MGSAVSAIFKPAGLLFAGSDPTLQKIADPLGVAGIVDPPGLPRLPKPKKSPKATDPAVVDARKKEAVRARKGRKATILTGGGGITSDAPLSQPSAGSAELLGA